MLAQDSLVTNNQVTHDICIFGNSRRDVKKHTDPPLIPVSLTLDRLEHTLVMGAQARRQRLLKLLAPAILRDEDVVPRVLEGTHFVSLR